MSNGSEEPVTQVFAVRGRPVGFRPSRFGGALTATERGYFPVSSTGFRSLAGQFGGGPGHHDMISTEFLESLAAERDREHQQLLRQLRDGVRPVGHPVANYVHVSLAFEKAVQSGFFATERERTALWSGAHHLLCLVDSDPRFQPVPHPGYPAWGEKQCAKSHAWARSLLALLKRLATGELPGRLPVRLLGPSTYLELPPRPGGEPKTELGGFVAEMALQLPITAPAETRTDRAVSPARERPTSAEIQMGLFEAPTVATKPDTAPAMRVRHF